MIDDLISRQAAIDAIEFGITYAKAINKETGEVKELFQASNDELRKAEDRIKQLPSAQRTGRWIDDELMCKARCSVCGEEFSWMDNDMDRFLFCPHCGARMEEENG